MERWPWRCSVQPPVANITEFYCSLKCPTFSHSVTENEPQTVTEEVCDKVTVPTPSVSTPVENDDKMDIEQEEPSVNELKTVVEPVLPEDSPPIVIRLSNKELALVGVLCSFLHVCPIGATPSEICAFVLGQCPGVGTEIVLKLLKSLPNLFCEILTLDGSHKWKFCGFETASD